MRNADILDILVKELGLNKHATREVLTTLEELGGEFHSICEDQCNVGTTPEQDERQESLRQSAEFFLTTLHPDLKLYVNTDPRGLPFGIILPSGRSNNFGGIDWRLDTDTRPERD